MANIALVNGSIEKLNHLGYNLPLIKVPGIASETRFVIVYSATVYGVTTRLPSDWTDFSPASEVNSRATNFRTINLARWPTVPGPRRLLDRTSQAVGPTRKFVIRSEEANATVGGALTKLVKWFPPIHWTNPMPTHTPLATLAGPYFVECHGCSTVKGAVGVNCAVRFDDFGI